MTRKDLIDLTAEKTGLTKTATKAALDAFIDITKEALANQETLKIGGFLTLEGCMTKERICRNPSTGEEITVAPHKTVKVKVSSALKK